MICALAGASAAYLVGIVAALGMIWYGLKHTPDDAFDIDEDEE